MGDFTGTWHHGLVARWWAEFNRDRPEIAYHRALVEEHGDPALDAGCGTGRLLIPLLQAGLDIDGCDISPDMLALCRQRAEVEGLAPTLYAQPMHDLDLPRHYRTIFLCGSFGIGGSREYDAQALERLHAHLAPGGLLVLDTGVRTPSDAALAKWVRRKASQLPEAWPADGDRRRAANGDELELRTRRLSTDLTTRVRTTQIRVSLLREGTVIEEEEREIRICLHSTEELSEMLLSAGFSPPEIVEGYSGGYSVGDEPATIFLACKPT